MRNDGVRQLILSRRVRFVAAALTGAGLCAAACDTEPNVCLSIEAPGGYGGAGGGEAGTAGGGGIAGQVPTAGGGTGGAGGGGGG